MEKEEGEFNGPDGRKYVYHKGIEEAQNKYHEDVKTEFDKSFLFARPIYGRPDSPVFDADALNAQIDKIKAHAIKYTCDRLKLELSREIMWVEEAVTNIGTNDFDETIGLVLITSRRVGKSNFSEYAQTKAEVRKLKHEMWEIKVEEHIKIQRALWNKEEDKIPDIKLYFEELWKLVNAKLVGHILEHGSESQPNSNWDLPFKGVGIIIPQGNKNGIIENNFLSVKTMDVRRLSNKFKWFAGPDQEP